MNPFPLKILGVSRDLVRVTCPLINVSVWGMTFVSQSTWRATLRFWRPIVHSSSPHLQLPDCKSTLVSWTLYISNKHKMQSYISSICAFNFVILYCKQNCSICPFKHFCTMEFSYYNVFLGRVFTYDPRSHVWTCPSQQFNAPAAPPQQLNSSQ